VVEAVFPLSSRERMILNETNAGNRGMGIITGRTALIEAARMGVSRTSVVRRLLTPFYIDDGLATIATTVPRVIHTHQTLITTNA